jgi:hypothetical protein
VLLKGTNGLSILLGSGPPANSLGVDGQPGYLDTTSNLLYGPKVSGAWPTTGTQFGGNFILKSGAPASVDGQAGNLSLDITAGFIYGPKTSSGWPSQPLLSLVGPRGVAGPVGPSYTPPADQTANSLVLAPVSGNTNAVQLAIKNSAGAVLWGVDTNGNEVVGGTLNVTGNATFNANVSAKVASVTGVVNSGNETIAGTLNVTGTSTLGTTKVNQITFADNTTQTSAVGASPARQTFFIGGYVASVSNGIAGPLPTSDTPIGVAIPINNSTSMDIQTNYIPMYRAGTVTDISAFTFGATGSGKKYYFTMAKNLNSTGQVMSGSTTTYGTISNATGGTTTGSTSFVAGDYLSMMVRGDSGNSGARVFAYFTVTYT